MLVTTVFALAFAALVAAEGAEVEHEHEARAPYAATLYSQPNFRGHSRRIDTGRCYDLRGPLRNDVQSIRVDRGDDCYLYERDNCHGRSSKYPSSDRHIRSRRVRSVRCVRERRHH